MKRLDIDDILAELDKPLSLHEEESWVSREEAIETFSTGFTAANLITDTKDKVWETMTLSLELFCSELLWNQNNFMSMNFGSTIRDNWNINATYQWMTVMHWLTLCKSKDLLTKALDLWADATIVDSDKQTIAHIACENSMHDVLELILNKRPELDLSWLNSNGRTPYDLCPDNKMREMISLHQRWRLKAGSISLSLEDKQFVWAKLITELQSLDDENITCKIPNFLLNQNIDLEIVNWCSLLAYSAWKWYYDIAEKCIIGDSPH